MNEIVSTDGILSEIQAVVSRPELPNRPSYFQIKNFIIAKEPTTQSQLWSAIREMRSRYETIQALDLQIATCEDNLELVDVQLDLCKLRLKHYEAKATEKSKLLSRQQKIKLRKLEREKGAGQGSLTDLKERRTNAIDESAFILQIYKHLEQLEELKPFDDEQVQREYWNERLSEQFHTCVLLSRPFPEELIKTILVLPDDTPIKVHVTKVLEKRQELLMQQKHLERPKANSVAKIQRT